MKTIKQVSKLSGASVRTLQYYDNIHLLTPSRTASSYRLYSDDDIAKLQQILFLKELGFSLKEIRELINHPNFDQSLVFRKQKELLCAKRRQVSQVIQILERLENGASLDDCAADIKSITKESKTMKKSIKITLFILPIVLLVGIIGAYQVFQHLDNSNPNTPPSIVADVINLNPVVGDSSTNCYALDIINIKEADFPAQSPTLEWIALPEDLRDNLQLEAFYPYKHEVNDQVINYSIKAFDGLRYVYIGFSPDRTPVREMYAPEGESSIINEHEVMIGHNTGQVYIEERDAVESIEKYYIDFTLDSMNYSIETHGLSETEAITLLKSLL